MKLLTAICLVALPAVAAARGGVADVDGRRIEAADREPQNRMSTGRDDAEDRFSPSRQINAGNVAGGTARLPCRICHGTDAISGGMTPDLRYLAPETHADLPNIVLYGARAHQGMPSFVDPLAASDVEAIHAYLIDKARALGEPQ